MDTIFFDSMEFEQVPAKLIRTVHLIEEEIADIGNIRDELSDETGRFDYLLKRLSDGLVNSANDLLDAHTQARQIKEIYERTERVNCRMVDALGKGDSHDGRAKADSGKTRLGDLFAPAYNPRQHYVLDSRTYINFRLHHEMWLLEYADRIFSREMPV